MTDLLFNLSILDSILAYMYIYIWICKQTRSNLIDKNTCCTWIGEVVVFYNCHFVCQILYTMYKPFLELGISYSNVRTCWMINYHIIWIWKQELSGRPWTWKLGLNIPAVFVLGCVLVYLKTFVPYRGQRALVKSNCRHWSRPYSSRTLILLSF